MSPEQIAERLQEFEALCRRQGVSFTVQRRLVLEVVLERDDHPTADQIVEIVKQRLPNISRTTVYRVLDALVDMGMIRRLHHPGPAVRYDGKVRRHHHLICKRCHKVIDWEDARLNRIHPPNVEAEGFQVEDFSVHFTGVCGECGKKTKDQ